MKKRILLPLVLCVSAAAFADEGSSDLRCQERPQPTPANVERFRQRLQDIQTQQSRESSFYSRDRTDALYHGNSRGTDLGDRFRLHVRTMEYLGIESARAQDCIVRSTRRLETWDASRCIEGAERQSVLFGTCDHQYVFDTRFEFTKNFTVALPADQNLVYFQNGQVVSQPVVNAISSAIEIVSSQTPVPSASSTGSYCQLSLPESSAGSTVALGPSSPVFTYRNASQYAQWLGNLSCYQHTVSYQMRPLSDYPGSAEVRAAESQHSSNLSACRADTSIEQMLMEKRGEVSRLQRQVLSTTGVLCAAFYRSTYDDALTCNEYGLQLKSGRGYIIEKRNARLLSETTQSVMSSQAYSNQVAEQSRIRQALEASQAEEAALAVRWSSAVTAQRQCEEAENARYADQRCLVRRSELKSMLSYSGVQAALGDYVNISVDVGLEEEASQ